jgi:hypothetical protein
LASRGGLPVERPDEGEDAGDPDQATHSLGLSAELVKILTGAWGQDPWRLFTDGRESPYVSLLSGRAAATRLREPRCQSDHSARCRSERVHGRE